MRNLKSAIQFLTILPAGKSSSFDADKIIPYFPIVGILLGILISAFDRVAFHLWPMPVVSLLDVLLLTVLTGALHIDGLGDTADGLFGHRPRDKALSIMKDSRIGVMGLVAIIFGLSVKWCGIMSLAENRSLILLLVPAYSRCGMIFGIYYLPYGRPNGGTGFGFFKETIKPSYFMSIIIPVFLSFFLGLKGIIIFSGFITITAVILYYYKRRMGCITGDMLGAMTETTESLLFLLVSAGGCI